MQSDTAQKLVAYIQKEENIECPISWENVLSGAGIGRIYRFLATQQKYGQTLVAKNISDSNYHPEKIFAHWRDDSQCNNTFKIYASFYGACAKNFALETLALGSIYIAGGIAANNLSLFELQEFHNTFTICGKQADLIKSIPIYIIADYNVSLFGAAAYLKDDL